MHPIIPTLVVLGLPLAMLRAQDPTGGVDLSGDEHANIGEALGQSRRSLGDWIEHFDLSGQFAASYLHTGTGGKYPDGAFLIHQADLYARASIKDVGEVFLELRLEYFPDDDSRGVGLGEAYMQFRDVAKVGSADLGLKIGRFDLPFGEYYLLEDPDQNRMVGYPIALPYRWDEGVQAYLTGDDWGANLAVTQGTYSRNSDTGVAPAITAKIHTRASDQLYLSASAHYVDGADATAVCFSGGVITPVTGSPSTEVRSMLVSLDTRIDVSDRFLLQASLGGADIDDEADAFDRDFYWWILEPSYAFSTEWRLTGRWSAVGTFDSTEGYRFEGRPYGNGRASYGFEVDNAQRFAVAVAHNFHPNVIGKCEVGIDRFVSTRTSGLGNDDRLFFGAELVVTF